MTMDANELRALADSIVYRDSLAIARAADYLRAQADAQPVAWRCEVRGDGTDPQLGAGDWRHYHTTTSKREAQAFVARCGNGIEGRAVPLYPRAAAPQAEPKREPNPNEVICPACTHQFRAIPENVQAQLWAKREPLSDWRIGELYRQWLAESGTTTITDLMRSVERAHEIGGSDAGTD